MSLHDMRSELAEKIYAFSCRACWNEASVELVYGKLGGLGYVFCILGELDRASHHPNLKVDACKTYNMLLRYYKRFIAEVLQDFAIAYYGESEQPYTTREECIKVIIENLHKKDYINEWISKLEKAISERFLIGTAVMLGTELLKLRDCLPTKCE